MSQMQNVLSQWNFSFILHDSKLLDLFQIWTFPVSLPKAPSKEENLLS